MNKVIPALKKINVLAALTIFAELITCGTVHAASGESIAQALNTRFNDTVSSCPGAGGSPAFACSGILIRTVPAEHAGSFWTHDATAISLEADSLVFLRADIGTRTLESDHGAVFLNPIAAEARDKAIDILCAYPFSLEVKSDWTDYGCSQPTKLTREEDPNSCIALGVTDAAGWLAHFSAQNNEPDKQCSLSSRVAVQFKASMEAHQQMGPLWSTRPNQLRVRNWDDQRPTRVPVEALFYNSRVKGALFKAHTDQYKYFQETGYWLPILQLDLNRDDRQVFSFRADDQLEVGFEVAAKLNARYADTSPCPDGSAPYFCNGVLYRGVGVSEDYHSWNPSPGNVARDDMSFSYLRSDIGRTVFDLVPQGFIFKQLSSGSYPVTLRCVYPWDVGVGVGVKKRQNEDPCDELTQAGCEELGVTRFSIWVERYGNAAGTTCSFSPSTAQFQLSIEVRAHRIPIPIAQFWNELIFAAWPQNIPLQLPLEAFTYNDTQSDVDGARFIQTDYFDETERFLPVIHIHNKTDVSSGHVFTYSPSDQSFNSLETARMSSR